MASESVGPTPQDAADRAESPKARSFAEELAGYRRWQHTCLPLRRDVETFVDRLLALLFPQLSDESDSSEADVQARLTLVEHDLRELLKCLVNSDEAARLAAAFSTALPDIHHRLCLDAEAIFAEDPAAESPDEVIAAYPGFLAIGMYRIAHELRRHYVRILPRLLTEIAHGRTGIDIHPDAEIGESFCIDHGTGVVIGETAIVGDHVKVYQGVTLGALSVSKSGAGTKRHPTVEDRVVIYANATILGGDTVVGHDSVIGGNVWLPTSVAPYSFVHQTRQVRVRSVRDANEPSDYVI